MYNLEVPNEKPAQTAENIYVIWEIAYTYLYVYWYHLISLYLLPGVCPIHTVCDAPEICQSLIEGEAVGQPSTWRPLVGGTWFCGAHRCRASHPLSHADLRRAQLLKNTWNPWRSQKWCRDFFILSVWWFHIFFIFTPIWGRFPFWLIFFKGVLKPPSSFVFFSVFRRKDSERAGIWRKWVPFGNLWQAW